MPTDIRIISSAVRPIYSHNVRAKTPKPFINPPVLNAFTFIHRVNTGIVHSIPIIRSLKMVLGPRPPPDDWLCWFSNNAHDQPEAVKVSANIRPIIFSIFIIFWFAISFPPPLNYPVDIDKGVGCVVAFKWRGGQGWNLWLLVSSELARFVIALE